MKKVMNAKRPIKAVISANNRLCRREFEQSDNTSRIQFSAL
jgi:hypothetical protein